jgi:hypothetical protein
MPFTRHKTNYLVVADALDLSPFLSFHSTPAIQRVSVYVFMPTVAWGEREHVFFQRGKERRLLKKMKKHGKFFNEDIDTAPVWFPSNGKVTLQSSVEGCELKVSEW